MLIGRSSNRAGMFPAGSLAAWLLAAGLCGALPATVSAQTVESFYKSHPLNIVIGFTPGGGYDLYGRTVGRHISKHLPGDPNVVPQNMPGAGSLKAINYLANQAPKDGSTIATFSRGIPMEPLMGNQEARFDPLKLNWIGSPSQETNIVFAWHTTPFKVMDDLEKQEMIVASTGQGADTATFPLLLGDIFKSKVRVVTGYPGAAETLLAVERGEAHGLGGLSWGYLKSARPDWMKDNKINVILQFANTRNEELKSVPMATELVKSEADRQLLDMFVSRLVMAWPFAAPADVPVERVQALRAALSATMKDPDFLSEAQKQNMDVDPVSGEAIQALLTRIYASPPDVVARAREISERGRK
jgi:tripartite-type tricarboxylate transporter receptor subunit TctC